MLVLALVYRLALALLVLADKLHQNGGSDEAISEANESELDSSAKALLS